MTDGCAQSVQTEGGEQDDPLMPLLLSLRIQSVLDEVNALVQS